MNKSETAKYTELSKNTEMDSKTGKERSCLANIGIFVLVAVVISVIIGWIVLKIRGWKNLFETIRQAEEGTFIGNHITICITLCVIGLIVFIVFVIRLINKK